MQFIGELFVLCMGFVALVFIWGFAVSAYQRRQREREHARVDQG